MKPQVPKPALSEAPAVRELPSVSAPKLSLSSAPVPQPVIQTPAIQTNVFAEAPARLSLPTAVPQRTQGAGFDDSARSSVPAPSAGSRVLSSGFDIAAARGSAAQAGNAFQAGAFGQATTATAKVGAAGGAVAGAGFDQTAAAKAPSANTAAGRDVRKTGFDEPQVKPNTVAAPLAPAAVSIRPVEVLDKPKPAYTEEARRRKIEGTVLLDVIFAASGELRVLRVVRGLGYGLDEAAAEAARRIHFKPATQTGAPLDQRATLHVVFQLTE